MIKNGSQIIPEDLILSLTAGEALAARDAVYIDTTDGKVYKCDADVLATLDFIGFAQEAAIINGAVNVVHDGHFGGFSSLTIGAAYFVSTTAGAITSTAPTNVCRVGVATSATTIKIERRITYIDIQTFTADGTWTKPAGAKFVDVYLIGGGGGGGAGNIDVSTPFASGGGGGAGGGYSYQRFRADTLTSTVAVTRGAGGTGGTTAGQAGTAGGNTSFGSYLIATGGGGGGGGVVNGAAPTAAAAGVGSLFNGSLAGVGVTTIAACGGGNGGAGNAGAGGTGGGRATTATLAGGTGGTGAHPGPGGAGGNGNSFDSDEPVGGTGGGGGGGGGGNGGGKGGNGALYGGGGGGGGSDYTTEGDGGNGAAGIAVIISYL